MDKFYNREPWNLILGLIALAMMLFLVAGATSPWVLLAPVLLVIYGYSKVRISRFLQLRNKGYFSGTRVRDEWIYEESRDNSKISLHLKVENTEPGHYELFIPSDSEWRASVPGWAADRRDEIVRRIAEGWIKSDLHYPEDFKHI